MDTRIQDIELAHGMAFEEEQTRLEAEAVVEYTTKYRQQLRIRGTGETKPGLRLLAQVIEPFAAIIKEQLEHANRVKAGRRSKVLPRLSELTPEQLALITIRTAMQSITERKMKHIVAKSIGVLVAENAEWNILIKEKGGLAHVVTEQLRKTGQERHRRNVTRHVLDKYQPENKWTEDEMRGVGEYLLKELLDTGLLLTTVTKYNASKKKNTVWIVPTEQTIALLTGHIAILDHVVEQNLDVDLVIRGVDTRRVVDGVGVYTAAIGGELDPAELRESQVAAFADDLATQLGSIDAQTVVGSIAGCVVMLFRRLHIGSDTTVPEQIHRCPQQRLDEIVGRHAGVFHLQQRPHLLRERNRLCRAREHAAAFGNELLVIVFPARSRQSKQAFAFLEALFRVRIRVQEDV